MKSGQWAIKAIPLRRSKLIVTYSLFKPNSSEEAGLLEFCIYNSSVSFKYENQSRYGILLFSPSFAMNSFIFRYFCHSPNCQSVFCAIVTGYLPRYSTLSIVVISDRVNCCIIDNHPCVADSFSEKILAVSSS